MVARRLFSSVWKRFRNWFFAGLILILPFALTLYILMIGFRWIDSILGGLAARTLGRQIPGLGLVASLLLVVTIGAVASNFIGRRMLLWGETLLMRIPLLKSVYSTMKQVVDAFAGQDKNAFKEVAMIEYPRAGMWSIGFLTGDGFSEVRDRTGSDLLTVFIPTVPNPTTGFFVLLPREDVIRLDMTVEEALKITISGGAITPDTMKGQIAEKEAGPVEG